MVPFFSVIVPVYKVEPYLRECVDSILGQTFTDFELILVDDGSPDGCPAICDEYAAADTRVSVIHQKNAGLPWARKAGLLQAAAGYVSFIDSDDYILPDYLEKLHACITENNEPDFILHGLTRVYDDHKLDVHPVPASGYYDKAALEKDIYPYMIADSRAAEIGTQLLPAYVWNKPGKRQLYLEHYLQDKRIRQLEDFPMTYELLYHAGAVCVLDDCIYCYRIRSTSILSSYKPDFFRTLKLVYDYMDTRLMAYYPPAREQCRVWLGLYALNTVWDEFRCGHRFSEALRHVRTELDETGLMRDMDPALFSGLKRVYMTLLRHRMYFPVMAAARIQAALMPASVEQRYNRKHSAQQG